MVLRLMCFGVVVAACEGAAAYLMQDAGAPTALDVAKTTPAEATVGEPVPENALDRLLVVEKLVPVQLLAGDGWQVACLSRGDAAPPVGMSSCWPAQTDRNLGGSFVNVRAGDGSCGQWRTSRPVIHRRFEDTLCLARADVPGLSLRDAGKIVDIE